MVFVDPAMAEAMPASHVRRMCVGIHRVRRAQPSWPAQAIDGWPDQVPQPTPHVGGGPDRFVRGLTSGRNAVTGRRDWSEIDLSAPNLSHLQDVFRMCRTLACPMYRSQHLLENWYRAGSLPDCGRRCKRRHVKRCRRIPGAASSSPLAAATSSRIKKPTWCRGGDREGDPNGPG
jgi:hypothetical protein